MRSILSPRAAAALIVSSTLVGTAALAVAAPTISGDAPASCELRVQRQGGSLTLTALARGEARASGRYTLRVSGAGTDIRQGGAFTLAQGAPATLGTVTLSAGGDGYKATLDLEIGGRTLSCSKRVGGGI